MLHAVMVRALVIMKTASQQRQFLAQMSARGGSYANAYGATQGNFRGYAVSSRNAVGQAPYSLHNEAQSAASPCAALRSHDPLPRTRLFYTVGTPCQHLGPCPHSTSLSRPVYVPFSCSRLCVRILASLAQQQGPVTHDEQTCGPLASDVD